MNINKEENKVGGAATGKDFVFTGMFVKGVTEASVQEWVKRFPTLTRADVLAELPFCDEYYSGSDKPPPANWFFATSAWLKRTHERRQSVAAKVKRDDPMEKLYRRAAYSERMA